MKIPEPTIERLPVYYQCLYRLKENNVVIVSSEEISSRVGVKASQFRKDLSYFGEFGIQGLGYPVTHLMERIASIMQFDTEHKVAICGAGHLGYALARFPGFAKWGFKISHVFDKDPAIIGKKIGDVVVEDINLLPYDLKVPMGILTVPASVAKETASLLIKSEVNAILNFTGVKLDIPESVVVRNVDISHELAVLNFHLMGKPQ
ncbi:MAG: redox-sensing transcriptional repressor Rex [Candidatus Eremiobacteraeota bacterium]|nr:redox-sensing transcriptional repressor Rex [Candidatus Eremiobacteraeota bacterium]